MKNQVWIKLTLALAASLGLTVVSSVHAGELPPASNQKNVTYANNIRHIFDQSCTKCHSGDRPKAHLRLDSLVGVLKGGRDGKVIIPGDSAKSPLVLRVAHLSKDHRGWMPPLHNRAGIKPLTREQIGLIRAWIDQGAK